jgi:hypothetical protein
MPESCLPLEIPICSVSRVPTDQPPFVQELANHSPGYVAPTAYWVLIECALAIVSTCLPVLRPILHGWSLETMLRSLTSRIGLGSKNNTGFSKQSNTHDNTAEYSSTSSLRNKPAFSASAAAVEPHSYAMRDDLGRLPKSKDGIMVQREWGSVV